VQLALRVCAQIVVPPWMTVGPVVRRNEDDVIAVSEVRVSGRPGEQCEKGTLLRSIEAELIAFDVLHHDAGLFAVGRG
jgi:hypothetical protein